MLHPPEPLEGVTHACSGPGIANSHSALCNPGLGNTGCSAYGLIHGTEYKQDSHSEQLPPQERYLSLSGWGGGTKNGKQRVEVKNTG